MQKKLALITGGNGYLGTAITKELVSRGWEVASLSRSSKQFPCDVTDAVSVQNAVQKAVRAFGPICAAIHAAAAPLERIAKDEATADSIEKEKSVAVTGAKNLFEAIAPHILTCGVFIAITSDATKSAGELKMGGYIDAKKEMEAFVHGLHAPFRTELCSIGFLPGGLNSDLPEQVRSFFAAKSKPLEQVATEIADLCGQQR